MASSGEPDFANIYDSEHSGGGARGFVLPGSSIKLRPQKRNKCSIAEQIKLHTQPQYKPRRSLRPQESLVSTVRRSTEQILDTGRSICGRKWIGPRSGMSAPLHLSARVSGDVLIDENPFQTAFPTYCDERMEQLPAGRPTSSSLPMASGKEERALVSTRGSCGDEARSRPWLPGPRQLTNWKVSSSASRGGVQYIRRIDVNKSRG